MVRVEATGFPANRTLDIGFGPPASEYEVVGTTESNSYGTVSAALTVPAWVEPNSPYLVVLADGYFGPRAVSQVFHVTGADGRLTIVGHLTEGGIECPSLETPSGGVYTLLGEEARALPADTNVRITGTVAETSFCVGGIPLDVETIQRLE